MSKVDKNQIYRQERSILQLLSDRTDEYNNRTDSIFKRLKKVTNVLESTIKSTPAFKDGMITWCDVTRPNDDDNTLLLHLTIEFEIGTQLLHGDTIINVTEDTVDYLNRKVAIRIAPEIAELSKKEIKKALAKAQALDDSDTIEDVAEQKPISEPVTTDEIDDEAKRILLTARNPTGVTH